MQCQARVRIASAFFAVFSHAVFFPAGSVASEIPIRGQVLMSASIPLDGARVELHHAPRSPYERELRRGGIATGALATGALPLGVSRGGEDGRFEIIAPESGFYEIRVRMPGFLSMTRQRLVIDGGGVVDLRPVRLVRSVELRVLVQDPDGLAVDGARVHLPFKAFNDAGARVTSRFWRPPARMVLTGADGVAVLAAGRSEHIELWSQSRDFLPALPQRLALLTEKTLRLGSGIRRMVEVRDAAGRPVPGALLATHRFLPTTATRPEPVVEGVTAADGRLPVIMPREGSLQLSARTESGLVGHLTLEVSEVSEVSALEAPGDDGDNPAVLTVHPERKVSGSVTDSSTGRPIAGAWLMVHNEVVRSGEDGRFILTRPSTDIPIHAAASGFASATSVVRGADEGTVTGLDLRLKPALLLAGTVVDEDGEAIVGAALEADGQPFTRSDRDGAFRFSIAQHGSYQLTVVKDGFLPSHLTVESSREPVRVVLRRGRLGFGYVLDLSERPVADAEVRLWEVKESQFNSRDSQPTYLARTDKAGRFEISELKPGRFDLRATAAGFAPLSVEDLSVVFDAGGDAVDLGLVILEPGTRVAGRVEDAAGRPIADVKISYELWSSAGRLQPWELDSTEVTSDDDGGFAIGDLLPGEKLDLTLWHLDYVAAEAHGVPSPTEDLLVTLDTNSVVRGRVVGPEGAPIPGSRVTAHFRAAAGSQLGQNASCDEGGHFVLDRIGSRGIEIRASADGFLGDRVWLDLEPGEEVEGLVLELESGAVLEGAVFAPDGGPAVDTWVSTSPIGRMYKVGGAATDGQGRFRLSGLELGPRQIYVIADGFPRAERRFDIAPGVNRTEIHLEAGYDVRGQVSGDDGLPVPLARITLGEAQAASGEDGTFLLEKVTAGRHGLRATKSGFASRGLDVDVDGPIHDLEVVLSRGTRVSGRILGREQESLSHVQVWGWSLEGDQAIGTVDYDTFHFPPVAPGKWTFQAVEAVGGRRARGTLEIEEHQREARVDLEFHAGLVFSGSVLVDGEPEAGGTVRLRGLDVLAGGLRRIDYDGAFEFDDLRAGRYNLTVRGTDRGVLDVRRIDFDSDEHLDLDLATEKVWGEVVDALERRPLEGARLTLTRRGAPGEEIETTSDASGRFRFERLGEGSYRLQVEKEGYAAREQSVEVVSGASGDLTVVLEPTAGLTLSITSAVGAVPDVVFVAVLGSEVAQLSPVPAGRYLVTDEGTVRLASLPPGTWDVVVRSAASGVARLSATVPGEPAAVVLPAGSRLEARVPALVGGTEIATIVLDGPAGRFYSVELGGLRHEWRAPGGWAAVEGVPPGEWTVTATAAGGSSWTGRARTGGAGGSVQLVLD